MRSALVLGLAALVASGCMRPMKVLTANRICGVVNTNNRVVLTIGDMLYRLTEPVLRPIRSILPNLGGIDISPVILILILLFIRDVVLIGWIAPAFIPSE